VPNRAASKVIDRKRFADCRKNSGGNLVFVSEIRLFGSEQRRKKIAGNQSAPRLFAAPQSQRIRNCKGKPKANHRGTFSAADLHGVRRFWEQNQKLWTARNAVPAPVAIAQLPGALQTNASAPKKCNRPSSPKSAFDIPPHAIRPKRRQLD
jgi:hypothetical protein